MNFTTEQIECLMAALPGCTDARKRKLVAMILAEWARIDVETYLNRSPPEQVLAEHQLLEKLASCATELAQTLSRLGPGSRLGVAYHLSKGRVGAETGVSAWYNGVREIERRLSEAPARFEGLAGAATETAAHWDPPRVRRDTVIHNLILKDLAAVFEYATGQLPGRRIRTDAHVDAGQNYGPFWDFASTAWPVLFGSTNGLDYAVRFWAKVRAEHGESSAVVTNMHFRHPEWRIFEP